MKRTYTLAGIAALTLGLAATSSAQWTIICADPELESPFDMYSDDHLAGRLLTDLFSITIGQAGTATYGSDTGPCFAPAITSDVAGGYSFGVGPTGSVQSTFDDNLAASFGFPATGPRYFSYTTVDVDDESFVFSEAGWNIFYSGLSDRYIVVGETNGSVDVQLEAKLLGDGCRMRWRITNVGTETVSAGIRFGLTPAMITGNGGTDFGGEFIANAPFGKDYDNYVGFTYLPTRRPLRTEYKRDSLDQDFPDYVLFGFGQTEAYGLRLDNRAPVYQADATSADQIVIGNHGVILEGGMSEVLFGDATGGTMKDNDIKLTFVSTFQRFSPQPITPGNFRDVVHYVRSTWSVADYGDPYTAVLDAPRLVNFPGIGQNNQSPNPMQVRLWIDNQYATIDKEVPLNNVKVTLTLPEGLSLAPGENPVKFIQRIEPNVLVPLDFFVVSDGETFGDLPISVQIEPLPGPTKELETTIRVSAAPTISLVAGPNMISLPYSFGDNSLDQILGLTAGVDYVAYAWNPALSGYEPVTSIQRGVGYWVVPNDPQTSLALQNAGQPTGMSEGGLLVNLKQGWNLIGNPYNYPVPLSQLIGVAENNPNDSLTWNQLVAQDFISSSLTFFNPDPAAPGGGSYELTFGNNVLIQPHRAYWAFVRTAQPIRLIWPPLFQPELPGAGRAVEENTWKQSDRSWRLQIAARSTMGIDTDNYVGVLTDRQKADQHQVPKAPMAPGMKMEVAILDEYEGQPTRMAQTVSDRIGKKTWKVQVRADEAGEVTLTWPNLGTMPRGVRARITDDVTGEKKDLRAVSGYTFRMDKPGTRLFTLEVEPGGSSRPVIGNVLVRPAGRDANSPVVVNYALSADALITVRILSGTGKEVYTVTRGRSDSAGENSVSWTLRDNANRAVAPGTYQVEILAETPGGERVRKVVPVNVIR